IEAVEPYRQAFRRSEQLDSPWVIVSPEGVVADSDEGAQHLADGYALCVHCIRTGQGAIYYPTPETAQATQLPTTEYPLVADRINTRFVGTAEHVVHQLQVLQRATGADELLISSISHDHQARVRSFELL